MDAIPTELRSLGRWVAWQYVLRKNKKGQWEWTKVPINARTRRNASSTGPSSWSSAAVAFAAFQAYGLDGIGFVFAPEDGYTGIDFDDCVSPEGVIDPVVAAMIASLSSYAEFSPSGRGVKVFIKGRVPGDLGHRTKKVEWGGAIEAYCQGRFFTVTGRHVPGTPTTVEERQAPLDQICEKYWPATNAKSPVPPPLRLTSDGFPGTDQELIDAASTAANGAKFKKLFAGDTSDHRGDNSAADQALCCMLAFWTGRDAARMDRLFRMSGLYREKWERQDYRDSTIARAIELCPEVYRASAPVWCGKAGTGEPADAHDDEDGGLVPLGQRDPETGRLVLSQKRTLPTARAYVAQFHEHHGRRTLLTYANMLMEWKGNRYLVLEDSTVRHRLQPWLHKALRYVRRGRDIELVPFESNPASINSALESVRSYTHLPVDTPIPSWLDGRNGPAAIDVLACRSANVHLPTAEVFETTPALFTTNALEFDFVPDAPAPVQWLSFLDELWEDDPESIVLLQDWFGYCLTPDTRQQKMLLLVGPRRSGKGTIGRVQACLVGAVNVAGPTVSSLAGLFGLQPLIGKTLAIVSDARFHGEAVPLVTERLLCISGEDTLTIDRKHLPAVTLKLPTRFMFLTNELPRLTDSSHALAGRFVVIRLLKSFYGKEDPRLTEKLLGELPGILNWAIAGWRRLRDRGYFVQPASSNEAIRELEDLSSPVGAFVRDCCEVGPGKRVWVDDVFKRWKEWCTQEGRDRPGTKQGFGKDLAAAVPGVVRRRGTGDQPFYEGIDLVRAPYIPI